MNGAGPGQDFPTAASFHSTHAASPSARVAAMSPTRNPQTAKHLNKGSGQQRHAVFAALALPNDDLFALEIEILHAKASALEQPKAGSVR